MKIKIIDNGEVVTHRFQDSFTINELLERNIYPDMWENTVDCGCYYSGYDEDDELCLRCEGHGKLKASWSELKQSITFVEVRD